MFSLFLENEIWPEMFEEPSADIVVYSVSRRECENKDMSRFIRMFHSIEKIGATACQKIQLTFDGYDEDPRELYDIPEVCAYIYEIEKHFPHIWYYANVHLCSFLIYCIVPFTVKGKTRGEIMLQLNDEKLNGQFAKMAARVLMHGVRVGNEASAKEALENWRKVLYL